MILAAQTFEGSVHVVDGNIVEHAVLNSAGLQAGVRGLVVQDRGRIGASSTVVTLQFAFKRGSTIESRTVEARAWRDTNRVFGFCCDFI